jgi:hypothetical protein
VYILVIVVLIIASLYVVSMYRKMNDEQKARAISTVKKNKKTLLIMLLTLVIIGVIGRLSRDERIETDEEQVSVIIKMSESQYAEISKKAKAHMSSVEKYIVDQMFAASSVSGLSNSVRLMGKTLAGDNIDTTKTDTVRKEAGK